MAALGSFIPEKANGGDIGTRHYLIPESHGKLMDTRESLAAKSPIDVPSAQGLVARGLGEVGDALVAYSVSLCQWQEVSLLQMTQL